MPSTTKTIFIILGDLVILYGSLALTLSVRYGYLNLIQAFGDHLKPFSFIFILWILIFYISDLYELRKLRTNLELLRKELWAVALSVTFSIILFYLFPGFFKLTPKTNLLIFSIVFGLLDFALRGIIIRSSYAKIRLLILGDSDSVSQIVSYLKSNEQIGYEVCFWLKDNPWLKNNVSGVDAVYLKKIIIDEKIDTIVIPSQFVKNDLPIVKLIYQLLSLKIDVIDSINFFEMVFQKVPVEELEEGWFIEKITMRREFYDALKRLLDLILGIFLTIFLTPAMLLISLLIKVTSPGPIIFRQSRMGKDGKPFVLYKFRTMVENNGGPLWTTKEDKRITSAGKIIRVSHLDELPQLINIIKGDLSFTGPRAERFELAEMYSKLPRYEMRHIIKPGLTGWAQVNYRPSASPDEALEKLKYDIYYIKNRSFILDILILLKTVRLLFGEKR